jgi:uncharacterized membrane protein YoaK (UPF0700 family)
MLDAWVYIAHGHVFANAQTGNIVLFAINLAAGDTRAAWRHIPSLAAFTIGLLLSRVSGTVLKRWGRNSRTVRLGAECVLLVALAAVADHLPDDIVTACVGFLAALQITSLSHIGHWSFNTAMTTGNINRAVSALTMALFDPRATLDWLQAATLGALCVAFGLGAIMGAWLTPRWAGMTLLAIAGLVLAATLLSVRAPDPLEESVLPGQAA